MQLNPIEMSDVIKQRIEEFKSSSRNTYRRYEL